MKQTEIDFSKIVLKDIEGNDIVRDISKELGNALYFGARDIAVAELGRRIYQQKRVVLSKKEAEAVRQTVKQGFLYVVQAAVLPLLETGDEE